MNYKKIFIIGGIIILAIIVLNVNYINKNTNTPPTNNPQINSTQANSIAERKKELGIDYTIIIDRSLKMSREGRNFSAVFSPTEPQPTTEQLKTLGEIIRDEYKTEPFLWLSFYNDPEAARKDLSKYNVDINEEWEIVKNTQNHLIMQYNKNNASSLNQLEIYPNGLQATEYKGIIRINY